MKKYFLHDGISQHGPFDLAELQTKIITPQTMVWYESLPDWKPAGEIEELRSLLNSKVPASQILTPPVMTAKEEDWSKKSFYYADSHGQQGPFTLEQLKSRDIKSNTQVWYDPLPEWTSADKVPGLKGIINHDQKTSVTMASQKRSYYYLDSAGQKQGPFELEHLKGKSITDATMIWYDPLPEWIKAGSEASLKDIISHVQPVAAVPVTQKRSYYYLDSAGQKQGPFELEHLKGRSITAATLIWYDPLPEWIKAGNEAGLRDIISAAQPTVVTSITQKRSYYYLDSAGQKQGPFELEHLKGRSITAATLIWYDPLPEWIKAGNEASLRDIISAAQPTVVAPVSQKRLYYYLDSAGQKQGPFELEHLKGRSITAATLIWYDPLPEWIKAGSEASLKDIFSNPPTADLSKKLFYYTDATGQQGPLTLEQLRGRGITASTPVWYDPLPQWTTAGQVDVLRGIIG